jgi:tripartite-type tricarboxylate transporter receptor subunit TctC
VVVENRDGAGGQISVTAITSMAPDGLSVLLTPMSILGVYPHTYSKLPYDAKADLTPVSMGVTFDYAFAVGPTVPDEVQTIPQFMDWARKDPTRAMFGSPAPGSTLHFTGIMLGRASGLELTHVGFRGSQAAIKDLMGGQLPALVGPLGEFMRHLSGGRLRVLGTSGAEPSRFINNVQTFGQQGFDDLTYSEWYGFFLPAGAKPDTVSRLNAALHDALKRPDVIESLDGFGLNAAPSSPAALQAALEDDGRRWAPVVKAIGFKADA